MTTYQLPPLPGEEAFKGMRKKRGSGRSRTSRYNRLASFWQQIPLGNEALGSPLHSGNIGVSCRIALLY
jgi:hypothetical protein